MHPALAADRMDRHDVRVVQQGRGLGLGLEPLELVRVEPAGQGQDLQGDPTAERELLGLIDDPHATAADFAEDPEIAHDAQLGAGERVRQRRAGSIPHSRTAQLGHHLQGGKQLAQSLGMLRVLSGKSTRIDRLARLEALEVLLDQLRLDPVGPAGGARLDVHGDGHGDSPRMVRSRLKARR